MTTTDIRIANQNKSDILNEISQSMGFITKEQVDFLLNFFHDEFRLKQVCVRTGMGRFVCALQELEERIKQVELAKDYVRDVSANFWMGGQRFSF